MTTSRRCPSQPRRPRGRRAPRGATDGAVAARRARPPPAPWRPVPASRRAPARARLGLDGAPVSRRIGLGLTLHNHQPVGNFGWVIAETYERAYLPMLEALERHGGVHLALHYSGPLLAWIRAERPEFIERLVGLVAREQVEIVGGGW